MLMKEDVIGFYEAHNLIPGPDTKCSFQDYLLFVFRASERSQGFGLFVRETLQATITDHRVYRLNVNSWEELFNYYCSFMAGYIGNKT